LDILLYTWINIHYNQIYLLTNWRCWGSIIGMSDEPSYKIDQATAQELSIKAANAFKPRAPINTRELFAGRWEQLTTVVDAVSQTGLHIIIFGERGVGKTSLANMIDPLLYVMEGDVSGTSPEPRLVVKVNTHSGDSFSDVWCRAFDEVYWDEDRPALGFKQEVFSEKVTLRTKLGIPDQPSIDDVRRTLNILNRSVFIFDEFDRGGATTKKSFTDLIKVLSDYAVNATIVIVGVSGTVDGLVRDHASIVRSIVQIQLPRMDERELKDILSKASNAIEIYFTDEASSLIVGMSQGLPHYTHLIGLHATREAVNRLSRRIEYSDVHNSFNKAVSQTVQSIRDKYMQGVRSAHKEALYDKVLLACAIASSSAKDALGYFHPSDIVRPLSTILSRNNVVIATFQKHINEFCEEPRGKVLERHGAPRSYKYRFRDPLLPPYIFMTALSKEIIDPNKLSDLTSMS